MVPGEARAVDYLPGNVTYTTGRELLYDAGASELLSGRFLL
jgi:hypothetical protein